MHKILGRLLVFCQALGLTVTANTTASADIDTSTVEAGRVVVKGKIDRSQGLVVRIDRGDKPVEWRSGGRGGEFQVTIEASDKIPLDDGKMGQGFVVTTKQGAASNINYVHCAGELAGTFAIRRETDFVTKDGVLTFADVTLKDGKKLPVSVRLAPSRTAAPARADDAEAKEALPAQAKQPKPPVVQAGKTASIEELIPDLPRVEDLLVGPYLSKIKLPISFTQGFRFRFPYDGGGAMKTFLLDRPEALYQ